MNRIKKFRKSLIVSVMSLSIYSMSFACGGNLALVDTSAVAAIALLRANCPPGTWTVVTLVNSKTGAEMVFGFGVEDEE